MTTLPHLSTFAIIISSLFFNSQKASRSILKKLLRCSCFLLDSFILLFTAVRKFYTQGDIFDDVHEQSDFINLSPILQSQLLDLCFSSKHFVVV